HVFDGINLKRQNPPPGNFGCPTGTDLTKKGVPLGGRLWPNLGSAGDDFLLSETKNYLYF
ncbi:MAG: hypothetical protein LBE80_08830, partial [Deltaproteobacteria bacterium]|nr:hypothetical protein [Deltaproteobacteria bacterium]